MKKLTLLLFMTLFITSTANAWELTWAAPTTVVGGYLLYYGIVGEPAVETDIGKAGTSYDLDQLQLVVGERYEFFLKAYNDAGPSSESDHLRWTYPKPPIIIEMADAPINILIRP